MTAKLTDFVKALPGDINLLTPICRYDTIKIRIVFCPKVAGG